MEELFVRPVRPEEMETVWAIYLAAREFMKRTGNPHQWGDSFPERDRISADIREGVSYAVLRGEEIVGVFALLFGEDPTYRVIDGAWLNDKPYGTIHRIASNGTVPGVFHAAITFALEKIRVLRIDTHEDNKVMQHLVRKHGFSYCGIIRIRNNEKRLAYQLDASKDRGNG